LPDPSISQIKNIVSEYVGLPLGSAAAKEKLENWSWFLFYGAMGTGKTMSMRALQTETNSVVFDLTPDCVK
jgi:AAA+ superfamily predicted ATPase